ncbi:MAG: amino acid ABC transporter permease [Hyphomicrobiales bacterium]
MAEVPTHLPNPPDRWSWAALAFAALCTLAAIFSTALVRGAIASLGATGAVWWLISFILIGVTAALFRPALQSLALAREAAKARAAHEAVGVRVATAAAVEKAQLTFGWGIFALLVLGFMSFVFMNDVAVGKTFFLLPLMQQKWWMVTWKFISVNIVTVVIAEILVLVWGLIVALARMVPGPAGQPIRALATVYCDVFRGLPGIVTLYLIGFGIPTSGIPDLIVPHVYGWFTDISAMSPQELKAATRIPVMWWCILALTLTYGAYVAEVYRAGIESIHWSQISAARSLGLSYMQTMRHVVVPQAVRRIMAPLLNDFIGLQKDTALVQVVGMIDAFSQSKIISSQAFNLSAVTIVAILFVIVTIPQARFVDHLLERDAARMKAGGA